MVYIAQHYAEGESVKFYALECAAKGKTPTFKGLIEHLRKKR